MSLSEAVRQVLTEAMAAAGLGLPDLAARTGLPLVYVESLWAAPAKIGTHDLADLSAVLDLDPWQVIDQGTLLADR